MLKDKPMPAVVLGVLAAGIGATLMVSGLALLGLAPLAFMVDANQSGVAATLAGAAELVVGISSLVLAFGFFLQRSWAWGSGMAVYGVALILAVVAFVVGERVGSVLFIAALSLLMLWYLYTPKVRAVYGH
jgi:hypothetical protein